MLVSPTKLGLTYRAAGALGVRYTGECEGPKFGTLVAVIPSENHSFTFKFRVEP
jgi:hypothetical protein